MAPCASILSYTDPAAGQPLHWPAPLAEVDTWIRSRGAECVLGSGALGAALLVGHLPEDAQPAWTFKTRLCLTPNPEPVTRAGLSLDMLCWPLRRRGLVGMLGSALRVGRAPGNEVSLPHVDVSKLHARLAFRNDTVVVMDAASVNGTTVNGQLVPGDAAVALRTGDTLGFGPIRLRFLSAESLVASLRRGGDRRPQ